MKAYLAPFRTWRGAPRRRGRATPWLRGRVMEGEGRSLVCRVARRGVDGSRAVGRLWCSGQGEASLVGRGAEADKCEEVHGCTNECEGMRVHCTALHEPASLHGSPTHGARCVGSLHCLYPAFTGLLSSPLMRKCASPRLACRGGHSVFALMHSTLMHSWTFILAPGHPTSTVGRKRSP